jgi:hypothetical protein
LHGDTSIGRSRIINQKSKHRAAEVAGALNRYLQPETCHLKPKDLCLIPMRVALAAQADGWWVRSVIIWAKPNPMPESVTDRPTDAYEHILMLTKSARYFWDADSVREPHARLWDSSNGGNLSPEGEHKRNDGFSERGGSYPMPHPAGRNLRNVWTFATQPYSGAHFATFPEELPRRCIRAATSEKGACRFCGTPWERVCHRGTEDTEKSWKGSTFDTGKTAGHQDAREEAQTNTAYEKGSNPNRIALLRQQAREAGGEYVNESQTIGWRPGCECKSQHGRTVPSLVLDPFGGSGTTGRVAVELNRRAVLCDLAYRGRQDAGGTGYAPLAHARTTGVQRQLI